MTKAIKQYNDSPKLVIGNLLETFLPFLKHIKQDNFRQSLFNSEKFLSDRSVLYGSGRKLVVTHFNVPHLEYLKNFPQYKDTTLAYPDKPVLSLSDEFLISDEFSHKISTFWQNEREPILVLPYAVNQSVLQAIKWLRSKLNMEIVLEGEHDTLPWIQQYIDSKVGFRSILGELPLLPNVELPLGFVCFTEYDIENAIKWFSSQNRMCLIKANNGESGIGNYLISSQQSVSAIIKNFDHLMNFPHVVEEVLSGHHEIISPSAEFYIPAGNKKPFFTYLSLQRFTPNTEEFLGVEIDKSLNNQPWSEKLISQGLLIADKYQQLGYSGYFDIDALINKNNQLFLVETNARFTGGTHAHEFATHVMGKDYINHFYIITHDQIHINSSIKQYQHLKSVIEPFLLSPSIQKPFGVVPTVTSSISDGYFGCMIIHQDRQSGLRLLEKIISILQ